NMMTKELERCGDIISGLLSFSRESTTQYTDTNLNEVLTAVANLTHHKMELQNIDLHTSLCENMLMINGDATRLQQCFLNLVFNAMEALPAGGDIWISSRLIPESHMAEVEIRDNGYGISKEHIDALFDPFFTTKGSGEGTGLGLFIVYGIVKNHGGEIHVQSTPSRETAFVLDFPLLTNNRGM
ncbi:MAG: ATP-binding protein, partial [Desulfovibrionales bacterium]